MHLFFPQLKFQFFFLNVPVTYSYDVQNKTKVYCQFREENRYKHNGSSFIHCTFMSPRNTAVIFILEWYESKTSLLKIASNTFTPNIFVRGIICTKLDLHAARYGRNWLLFNDRWINTLQRTHVATNLLVRWLPSPLPNSTVASLSIKVFLGLQTHNFAKTELVRSRSKASFTDFCNVNCPQALFNLSL